MSRSSRITTAGITVLVGLLSVAVVTSAFTPKEKRTISVLRQRIVALESLTTSQAQQIDTLQDSHDGLVGDFAILMENQTILSNDIDILDAGLKGIVAPDGPIAQVDRNLAMTQEIVFANHPPIALTGIEPIVTCTETEPSTCTVDIEWTSTPAATGQVEWGTTPEYGNLTTREDDLLGFHRQRIGSFPGDGTTYHFRILADIPDTGATSSVELTAAVG